MNENKNIQIGNRIKKIRRDKGLTTEEFALIFDPPASKGTVSKWENGKYLPNNKRLKDMAEFGGISVDYLLNGVRDIQGNDMPVYELSFYEYEILNATMEKVIKENRLVLLFDLIKLTKGNDTLGCVVRSTCAFDDGKLSIVYLEDCSEKYDTVFFEKKIPESIPMDKIVNLNDYLAQRKYVAGFGDFTKKFFEDFKKHVIEYVSAYTDTVLDEKDITFRFVNDWNRIYKI